MKGILAAFGRLPHDRDPTGRCSCAAIAKEHESLEADAANFFGAETALSFREIIGIARESANSLDASMNTRAYKARTHKSLRSD
ncbi:hypothetical protein H8A97_08380 [Bradyrhizobium sp. Arg62]|uniref:hypothetical protein n=1 Tax=Bradyrhizobium TaxID=374 RepID=UPI001E3BD24F|nr:MULTISPECIES: hypothetical protein [Bradyrhizobium]MCC8936985.1 hypothetical protein [Bradyrhizobium ivorense]MCC8945126.1 hypothetical protein [Bradyrhizobium brasilense]